MRQIVSAAALRAPLFGALFVCAFSGAASAQTVPAPWTSTDIGTPRLSGDSTYADGVFYLDAAGADVGGTTDEFHFIYQPMSGDLDISARVDSLTARHPSSKVGVMVRSSLTPGAAHAFALVSPHFGVQFQRRTTDGGPSNSTAGPGVQAPVWIRAVRAGAEVSTYSSTDGATWSLIGSDEIALGHPVYVGIALSSRQPNRRASAAASNVRATGSGPSSALPAGQQSLDVGALDVQGWAAYSAGAYSIRAAGRGIRDTADQFHFVHQPLSGNGEVVARVASIAHADTGAKAGVMIRESLAAGSRHAMVAATAGSGYAFERRPERDGHSEHTSGGSGAAPGWVRLVRSGNLFEAYHSSNGSTWTRIGADSIAMGDTVHVGLAVTSHNTTVATTAIVDNLTVTPAVGTENQRPAVSLTSPVAGAEFTMSTVVAVEATAVDPEDRMEAVEFHAGPTWIGRDIAAPYGVEWTAPEAGTYELTAVAHDMDGSSATSGAVPVTVLAAPDPIPGPALHAVSFTASTDHATNVTSYLFEVFAAGANPETASPVAASNLGKPGPAGDGTITVDRSTFFQALTSGTYSATVSAIGPGGRSRSEAVTFVR